MKILTKEEEDAHYAATLRGGISGGLVGLGVGLAGAMIAHKRWPLFHNLTLPFKSFIVTSTGTFAAVIAADKASRNFEQARHAEVSSYQDRTAVTLAAARQNRSLPNRMLDWGRENRYKIVSASWVGSMGLALYIVGRDKYLTRAQKLVQARVYAQGLTLLVLVASAGFEVADARRGESRFQEGEQKKPHVEAYQGEDLWKDMVEAEERREQRVKDRMQKKEAKPVDA